MQQESTIRKITSLTPEQRERISVVRAKWQNVVDSVAPIDPIATQSALTQLYLEQSLTPPQEFITVASPDEAFSTYDRVKDRVGRRMNCLWDYQLPLCDPNSYWRLWGIDRDIIHFASRRKPNKNGCYTFLSADSPEPDTIISKSLHGEIWGQIQISTRRDWCTDIMNSVWDRYPSIVDDLQRAADHEDPTCQAGIDQFVLLGPFNWVRHEVACVDFCHSELGIPRNAALYDSLETLLQSGSLVLTFEKLCIMCDRPVAIEPKIEFRDGSMFD